MLLKVGEGKLLPGVSSKNVGGQWRYCNNVISNCLYFIEKEPTPKIDLCQSPDSLDESTYHIRLSNRA